MYVDTTLRMQTVETAAIENGPEWLFFMYLLKEKVNKMKFKNNTT
jgi:hypothetical protein